MRMNLADILADAASKHPDRIAIRHRADSITYAGLARAAAARAARLRALGVAPGDRVLIFVPMSLALYEILLAVFAVGAVAVFVDAWADAKRLDAAVSLADCKAFIGIPLSFMLMLKSRAMRRVPVKLLPSFGKTALKRGDAPWVAHGCDPADPALITFTTGSTGTPKAALRSHGFLLEQHHVLRDELEMTADDVDLATLPIFVLNNLGCGATTIIPDCDMRRADEFPAEKVLGEIMRYGVTSTAGSPAFYARLATAVAPDSPALPLKRLYVGGAAVHQDFARDLLAAFPAARICALYGSTEAEPIASIAARELAEAEVSQAGLPAGKICDSIEAAVIPLGIATHGIMSEAEWQSICLPPDTPGEICVAGPHVLRHYYRNPEAERENKIHVGERCFHRTGDAGRLSGDGRLHLLGRASQVFRRADGTMCYPFLVESALRGLPGVSAVSMVHIEGMGAVLAVETEASHVLGQADIEARIAARGVSADRIVFMRHIPRDPRHRSKIDVPRLIAKIRDSVSTKCPSFLCSTIDGHGTRLR